MKKTVALLPLFIVSLTANAAGADQPLDIHVAEKLNSRYQDTSVHCENGAAAYHCNGVLIRVTDTVTTSLRERERNAASFSYLRADTGIKKLFSTASGVIVNALPEAALPALTARCSYVTNGATDRRPDACGVTDDPLPGYEFEWSRPCASQNIHTAEAWLDHWNKVQPAYFYTCSFDASTEQFAVSVKARELLNTSIRERWNEVVTTAWPDTAIKQMPFQALFYNVANSNGRDQVIKLQNDYYKHTHSLLPVVRLDLLANDQQIFSYHHEDQTTIPMLQRLQPHN